MSKTVTPTGPRLFAVVILATAGCALLSEDEEAITDEEAIITEIVEESIREEFDPAAEYGLPPAKGELVEGVDLEGTWRSRPFFDYTAITFKKQRDGNYSVCFESGGCLQEWVLHRVATYSGSTITLDKPVEEYLPATYTRMYTIRFNGTVFLIASERIRSFEEGAHDPPRAELSLLRKDVSQGTAPEQ